MSCEINMLRKQSERDLVSLLELPPILNSSYGHPLPLSPAVDSSAVEAAFAYFNDPEQAAHFDDYIAKRPRRLGHYAEYLLAYWLQHIERLEVLRQIQINVDKRSIGEFDLLFQTDTAWQWWEMCVKFYCCHQDGEELTQWIGPNARDNLGRKYQHLFEQQLLLDRSDGAQAWLQKHGIQQLAGSAFVKGYLFSHLSHRKPRCHAAINPQLRLHWYCHQHECHDIPCQRASSRFIIAPRSQWISPVMREPRCDELLSHQQAVHSLKQRALPGPRLLVELKPDSDGWWCEIERGFVMPDSWPRIDG